LWHLGAVLISVIVVNWNGAAHLRRCLGQLRAQRFRDFETIVVDNGSSDGSDEIVAREFPECRLLRQERNLGFAAANNLGARAASGAWLALLNNDAFPEPDWLEALARATAEHPQYSGFASCQLDDAAPSRLDGAGDAYHTSGLAWRLGHGETFGPPWDRPREVFAPCAAAVLYRRDAFLAAGGFDETFFCYFEDMDLAFRLRLCGARFLYLPQARVRHVGSASIGQKSDLARYLGHRNLVWTFVKNMPPALFWRFLPGHILLNLMSLLVFSLRGQPGAIWRAKWHALKGLPRVLRARRAIQAARTAPAEELERHMQRGLGALLRRTHARPVPAPETAG
jgi:GT2 family glycosyltransferase